MAIGNVSRREALKCMCGGIGMLGTLASQRAMEAMMEMRKENIRYTSGRYGRVMLMLKICCNYTKYDTISRLLPLIIKS